MAHEKPDKAALRAEALRRRKGASVPAAPDALARHGLAGVPLGAGAVIAGYRPIAAEIDPGPLMAVLADRGRGLALPRVIGPGEALVFARYQPGDDLVPGPHGTQEPAAGAPTVRPALVLIPLLAFDREGFRLGYGGGYYDRTLAALRASGPVVAVGLAFAFQEVPSVPHEANDQPLDYVLTEAGLIDCRGRR